MATRTYAVGTKAGVRRLDDHTTPWVDVSVLLEPFGFPITVILRDVMTDPLDSDKVFVVGDRDPNSGATGIYVSDDAGVVWTQPGGDIASFIASPLFYSLYEVWVVDSNIIYTCGEGGVLYKSTDAGATFNLVPVLPTPTGSFDPTGSSQALHFITDQIGVVSFDSYVLKTTDGGASWSVLNGAAPISTSEPIVGIHMSADEQNLTAVTPREILHSSDAGASWSIVDTWALSGNHLTWVDDTNLFAFGSADYRKGSTDGGATWIDLTVPNLSGPANQAGHMYDLLNGYYDSAAETMATDNGAVFGFVSETAPYQIQAIWTHNDPPQDQPCGCPDGYTYNFVTEECDGFLYHAAENVGLNYTVAPGNQILNYSSSGAYFYENIDTKPYPIDTQFAVVQDFDNIPLAIDAIVANDAWGDVGSPDTINGRLNLAGIWTDLPISGSGDQLPVNKWIGFTACVETPVDKQYYIGIAGDNRVRIRINGTLVVHFGYDGATPAHFLKWHMFPITLPAGTNLIELEGWNNNDFAAFAAEIYDADFATLTSLTTPAQVEAVTIFSTKDKIGQQFDIGTDVGWACPEGYDLSFCDGSPQCVQQLSVPFEPCNCYLITDCDDPMAQHTITTSVTLDPALIYQFDGYGDTCWTVEASLDCPPNDMPIIDVTSSYVDCPTCKGICYELSDCEGVEPSQIVANDLSDLIGQVVRITRCPDICWTVTAQVECNGVTDIVTLEDTFLTCEECNPPVEEPPFELKPRAVTPGYDPKVCTPEYIAKVNSYFVDAVFKEIASKRYGIEFCCEEAVDLQKWSIKKELLDLDMKEDPDICIKGPDLCCPPRCVTAVLIGPCLPPRLVTARIVLG